MVWMANFPAVIITNEIKHLTLRHALKVNLREAKTFYRKKHILILLLMLSTYNFIQSSQQKKPTSLPVQSCYSKMLN